MTQLYMLSTRTHCKCNYIGKLKGKIWGKKMYLLNNPNSNGQVYLVNNSPPGPG